MRTNETRPFSPPAASHRLSRSQFAHLRIPWSFAGSPTHRSLDGSWGHIPVLEPAHRILDRRGPHARMGTPILRLQDIKTATATRRHPTDPQSTLHTINLVAYVPAPNFGKRGVPPFAYFAAAGARPIPGITQHLRMSRRKAMYQKIRKFRAPQPGFE